MTELVPTNQAGELAISQAADQYAAAGVMTDYRRRRAPNTIRRHDAGLATFAEFLAEAGLDRPARALVSRPEAWAVISHGLVSGFRQWLLQAGYAVGTVNDRLSVVKVYAKLAFQARAIDEAEYLRIKNVSGYRASEYERIDERRVEAGLPTRLGRKKAEPSRLSQDQAEQLLAGLPETPQGRRDRLILLLLLDHGLRVGELVKLELEAFDLVAGEFTFKRPKVKKLGRHRLTDRARQALEDYLADRGNQPGLLLAGSRKDGRLRRQPGLAEQNVNLRMRKLGLAIGIQALSPHDLRHHWATQAARHGTPVERLMRAGGWTNPITPLTRYIEPARIDNEGVKLG